MGSEKSETSIVGDEGQEGRELQCMFVTEAVVRSIPIPGGHPAILAEGDWGGALQYKLTTESACKMMQGIGLVSDPQESYLHKEGAMHTAFREEVEDDARQM
jgi:hypothetical protein